MVAAAGKRMEGWFPEIGSRVINTAKLLWHVSAFLSGVGKAICTPPPDLRSCVRPVAPAGQLSHSPPASSPKSFLHIDGWLFV